MADDFDPANPFPPSKRGTNPRSLAALKKYERKLGDPPLNPKGNNGRARAERVAAILEGGAVTDLERKMIAKLQLPPGTPLIDALVHRDVIAGLGSSDAARKGLREAYAGRPHTPVDVTSGGKSLADERQPTTAETRQELDRVAAAIRARSSAPAVAAAVAELAPEEPKATS